MSLEDKLAIHEVIARYSYTWDAKDADGFALLFTEDGVWELVAAGETQPQIRMESRAAIRTMALQDFQGRLAGVSTRHHQTGIVIDALGVDAARTRTMVLVTRQGPAMLYHVCRTRGCTTTSGAGLRRDGSLSIGRAGLTAIYHRPPVTGKSSPHCEARHRRSSLKYPKNDPIMKAQTAVAFVDTNIIPDRNAGIGSLLWDLQNPQDPDQDGPPLLDPEFAFIDVGVSRAKVATALKTVLAADLRMEVNYVATERPEAVPFAHVTLLGDRAERIRGCLSRMISSQHAAREVRDWHCVVDHRGKVASIAYSYDLHGNEVWESYFMGRPFLYSGEPIEFSNPELDETLATDVAEIEARIDLERKRGTDPSQPGPSWDGYRMQEVPLEAGLAEFGITLQKTDVPQRIKDRQNVLFLGNVLNHFPQAEQARELDSISASMEEGDLVIVQVDEVETAFIEVLHVKGQGAQKTRERVRWINTKTLEVQKPVQSPGSWRQIRLKPEVERLVSRLMECLGRKVNSPDWSQQNQRLLVHQYIGHVLGTFFRALPVKEILRIAIREALRRLPSEGGPKGIPVFKDDANDAYGGALGLDPSPIVSEADFIHLGLTNPEAEKPPQVEVSKCKLGPRFSGDPNGASNLDQPAFTQAVPKDWSELNH